MADTTPEVQDQKDVRKEEPVIRLSPLSLELDDRDLAKLIGDRIKNDDEYYLKIKLDKRRKRNEEFWLGKQLDTSKIEDWQIPYVDNLIWRNLENRIGMASSKMPDITVIPPTDDPVSRDRANKIDRALDIRLNNENLKRLIKDGLRDNALSFIGAIKVRWDENIGENGDFVFDLVNPKKIGMDHTATIPHDGYSADNMEMIYEWIEEPVSLVCAKFPDAVEKIKEKLKITIANEQRMMAKMKYLEVWFTWYDKDGKQQECVCWKYGNIILDKMKNPYYDWEGITKPADTKGQDRVTQKGNPDKKGIQPDQPTQDQPTIHKNFFDQPRKPYIFFNYMNLGNSPIDDTSVVEQALPLQQVINKRGRQITEISDNANPKKVFAGQYITKEEARRVSQDPAESIWMGEATDDVRKAMTTIPGTPPSPILFQDLISNRGEMDAMFSTHNITRGEQSGGQKQSALSKQITKQGDLQMVDDLVEITVTRVISELSGWCIQMMKSMYTDSHTLQSVGKDGEVTTISIDQTLIDDGIGLQVKASTTDKQQRSDNAMRLVESKSIDPLSLYEDLDVSNPKERASRLLTFMQGQQDGFQSYERITQLDKDPNLNPSQESNIAGMGKEEAVADIQKIKEGQQPDSKGIPNTEYVQTMMEYINSGEFDKLDPQIQQVFQQFVEQLKQRVSQSQQMKQQSATQPMAGQPQM